MLTTIKNKKGFTLVEVIVVLVILAILAALLIPALTGYIDKANEKKIIAEARSLYVAAQAELSDSYGKAAFTAGGTLDIKDTGDDLEDIEEAVITLSELDLATVTTGTIDYLADGTIAKVVYKAGNYKATYLDGIKDSSEADAEVKGWTITKE